MDHRRLKDAALSLRGKRVVVAGLGLFGGGAAAARYLVGEGAEVLVTDLKGEADLAEPLRSLQGLKVSYRLGGHELSDFAEADLVVANPAIPFRSEFIQAAVAEDVPVTTEIGLFAARFPGRTIAVTGTSGKTTTTTLLSHMVANAMPDTLVGGNMGVSLLGDVASSREYTTAVLELSSFQLRYLGMMGWRPDIAVVTNFAPNHLDVHDDLDDYRSCKQQLIAHQTAKDVVIVNAEDEEVRSWAEIGDGQTRMFGLEDDEAEGVYVDGGNLVSREPGRIRAICSIDDLLIPGRHNQANACAAACAAVAAGVGMDFIAEALATFPGVEHRLEYCGTSNGVSFYNDSIATSPERTMVALKALAQPIVLIAGGSEKGLEYAEMGRFVSERAKQVVLIGETADRIEATISGVRVARAVDLDEAVRIAVRETDPGDIVLLSPASASYDMFSNFEERGARFKALFKELG